MFVRGEEGVGFFAVVNEREIKLVDQRQRLLIELRTTAYMNFFAIDLARLLNCFVERVGDYRTLVVPIFIAGDDDIGSVGEGFELWRQRVKCFAAHDDRVAHRERFKALKVVGYIPQELAVLPKFAVFPYGGNNNNLRL